VSLKDLFTVKGYDSTLGFVAFANSPHTTESELVKILRNLGAVLYCKTNIPTAMMMAETFNNVFGRTVYCHSVAANSRQIRITVSYLLVARPAENPLF